MTTPLRTKDVTSRPLYLQTNRQACEYSIDIFPVEIFYNIEACNNQSLTSVEENGGRLTAYRFALLLSAVYFRVHVVTEPSLFLLSSTDESLKNYFIM